MHALYYLALQGMALAWQAITLVGVLALVPAVTKIKVYAFDSALWMGESDS